MRTFFIVIFCGVVAGACRHKVAPGEVEVRHLVSVSKPKEVLYLDRLDNRAILQKEDNSGVTRFSSFLVGITDSLVVSDADKRREREKYIQYGMQQDWVAVVGGDSLKPVFMQEKPNLDDKVRESALVFEIPGGAQADTLVYRDTYGDWGTQVFVLNAIK